MAQNSGTPKFPAPIPNPLNSSSASSQELEDDEKTDPNLIIPTQKSEEITSSPLPKINPPALTVKMPEMGLLDPLMKDPSITEIMVNDLRNVMVEKEGQLAFSGLVYPSLDELNRLTRNILDITGRILSPEQPYVDTMLPDGSRVNIVGPPLTIHGPCITIRKFQTKRLSIHDFIAAESLDQRIAYFLNVCIVGQLNLLICGGTGSGKTTLLNALAALIPKKERVITIEDTPELVIQHFNSVRLQTKPQTPSSAPVTARDLVANSLRMRPDRIIIGECRRAEAFDMLQAMNTGHAGSMTTLHANSPRDGLTRLETLCMLAGVDLPATSIRKQIVSAIDLIIFIRRFRNGKRRVTAISEVTGMEGDTITLQDIFLFEPEMSATGQPTESGAFKATGLVPTLLDRLKEHGIELPRNYFA
jgi:pilus assembly protein CpaF